MICTNPTNAKFVLDQVLVPAGSDHQTIADLAGLTVAGGPGIQNMTLARLVFERGGAAGANVVELPFPQHVGAIVAGQISGAYSLEPQETVGTVNGTTRILKAGVISKYILGDPLAPWDGGAASLTSAFIDAYPDTAGAYIAAYRRGVEFVRGNPDEARQYFAGYTPLKGEVAARVPMSDYAMYDELDSTSIGYFQTFFDLFTDRGILASAVPVETMIYAG
ncbi:ABC transporter substrate-binding protein [Pseudochelatococcus sp. B33]